MTSHAHVETAPASTVSEGQPRGLYILFFTELWERFSFYGMNTLLVLYATGHLGFSDAKASTIQGTYSSLVFATPILGGLLADKWLGYKRTIILGGLLMMAGHILMAVDRLPAFYTALGLLILGVGGLKGNVSTVVGKLYRPGDERRDRGFTLFYMGINLGALTSPLICGWLGQRVSWHLGFVAAAVGMGIGLLTFLLGQRTLRGVDMGVPQERAREKDAVAGGLTREEWGRVAVLAIVSVFIILFWAAYIQTWISLTFWADRSTALPALPSFIPRYGGQLVPSTWFQSVNPVFVVALAPVLSAVWGALARRGREPSTPVKMILGLTFIGVSFLIMTLGALSHASGSPASPLWLLFCYLFMSLGELTLSPVGLSLVTKVAPVRYTGLLMGLWFLGISGGYLVGGWVGRLWPEMSHALFFSLFVASSFIGALVFLTLLPTMKRLMHGTV
jgi:POT family proton-dependent oligopeptide transporter